mmetsp:Transcript_6476/g.12977  ORF Transcript_6476/g.12977 Transcript_6476/m.12977 type:complete len:83 (-) Transcript_6476:562-810(-)
MHYSSPHGYESLKMQTFRDTLASKEMVTASRGTSLLSEMAQPTHCSSARMLHRKFPQTNSGKQSLQAAEYQTSPFASPISRS